MTEQDPWVHPPVFSEALGEELGRYKGLWVAFDEARKHVIASAPDLLEVFQLAEERGVSDPLTFHVPEHPERIRL